MYKNIPINVQKSTIFPFLSVVERKSQRTFTIQQHELQVSYGIILQLAETANDELKVFADKLGITDDSLGRALQAGAEKLEKEYDSGVLTPLQAKERQAKYKTTRVPAKV